MYFEYQHVINGYFDSSFALESRYEWDDLRRVLSETQLTTLPLWLMGSTQREQVIVDRLISEGADTRRFGLIRAKASIAERRYTEAVLRLEAYLQSASGRRDTSVYPLYLFSLCMADQQDRAQELAVTLSGRASWDPEEARYWRWLAATCPLPGFLSP